MPSRCSPPASPGTGGVPGALIAYSLVSDPDVPSCIWELGDFGQVLPVRRRHRIEVHATPGRRRTVELGPQFCDGGTGHVQGYNTIDIGGLTPADAAAARSRCWPRTTPRRSPALPACPSTEPPTTSAPSPIRPTWVGHVEDLRPSQPAGRVSTGPWENGGSPTVTVTYRGDGPQMCYQTSLPQDCALVGTVGEQHGHRDARWRPLAPATASVTVVAAPGTCMPTIVTDTDRHRHPAGGDARRIRPRCPGSNLRCSNRTALPDTVTFTLHGPSADGVVQRNGGVHQHRGHCPRRHRHLGRLHAHAGRHLLVGGDLQRRPAQPGGGVELWRRTLGGGPASPSLVTEATPTASLPGAAVSDSAAAVGCHQHGGRHDHVQAVRPVCHPGLRGAPIFTSTGFAVSGPGTYGPVATTVTTAGTYWWTATYSGDANNLAVASTLRRRAVRGGSGRRRSLIETSDRHRQPPDGCGVGQRHPVGGDRHGGRHDHVQVVRPVCHRGLQRHGRCSRRRRSRSTDQEPTVR